MMIRYRLCNCTKKKYVKKKLHSYLTISLMTHMWKHIQIDGIKLNKLLERPNAWSKKERIMDHTNTMGCWFKIESFQNLNKKKRELSERKNKN